MSFTRLIKAALLASFFPCLLAAQTVVHVAQAGFARAWTTGAEIQSSATYARPSAYATVFAYKNTVEVPTVGGSGSAVWPMAHMGFEWDDSSSSAQTGSCADYAAPSGVFAQASTSWAVNTWYWIGCWWDGTTLKIYVDGGLAGSVSDTKTNTDTQTIQYVNPNAGSGSVVADVSVWYGSSGNSLSIPSDADMKYLTNPTTACSADTAYIAPESLVGQVAMRGLSPEPDTSGSGNDGVITGTLNVVAGPCAAGGGNRAAQPTGLLTASSNGRYFQANGKTIVLAGSHTWYDAIESRSDKAYAQAHWSAAAYAQWLQEHGMNFTIGWLQNVGNGPPFWNSGVTFSNIPYNRSGTCCAADGGNKFDLTSYNDTGYFDPLYREIQTLNQDGIYVAVQVTSGSGGMVNNGTVNTWTNNPYRCDATACNNIQSANGDPNSTNTGVSMQSTTAAGNTYPGDATALGYEDSLVEHYIDKLGSLKGIIWEIGNEPSSPDPDCEAWAEHITSLIRTYESSKTYQHPILVSTGITSSPGWDGGCETLNSASPLADMWAPGHGTPTDNFPDASNPVVSPTTQVQLADSDHIGANTTTQDQLWRWFMRGWNVAVMDDPWNGSTSSTHTAAETSTTSGERYSLGYMLNFADQMPMQNVTPWDNTTTGIGKCGTTWCLTDDLTVYLMYYPTGSSMGAENITVNTSATTSTCEWFDPDTDTTSACTYLGTGSNSYTAPGTDPYVLFIH